MPHDVLVCVLSPRIGETLPSSSLRSLRASLRDVAVATSTLSRGRLRVFLPSSARDRVRAIAAEAGLPVPACREHRLWSDAERASASHFVVESAAPRAWLLEVWDDDSTFDRSDSCAVCHAGQVPVGSVAVEQRDRKRPLPELALTTNGAYLVSTALREHLERHGGDSLWFWPAVVWPARTPLTDRWAVRARQTVGRASSDSRLLRRSEIAPCVTCRRDGWSGVDWAYNVLPTGRDAHAWNTWECEGSQRLPSPETGRPGFSATPRLVVNRDLKDAISTFKKGRIATFTPVLFGPMEGFRS